MRIAEELEIEENYYKSYDFIWWTTAAGRNRQSYLYTSYHTLGDELTGNLDSTTSISVMKF